MKINTIAKKGIVLMVLFSIISCGGANSSGNKPNEQEKKEVKASQEEVSNKKEVKSYEEISDSEKPKFEAEEQEWFKNEEEKIKKELLSTDGMEEGARDYEMLFASGKADLAKKRAMELAKKYDELNK